MEVTIDSIDDVNFSDSCDAYTVYVGDHRILTISTKSELTATKWLKNALKSQNTKLPSKLVVGLAATTEKTEYIKGGVLPDAPYNLLQLCIGSHCLLYTLPTTTTPPRSLQNFFRDPRVMAIGVNIKTVAKNLERDFGIEIGEAVDINELAVKGMKRDDLDLGKYDLERLGVAVCGNHMYVERWSEEEEWVDWFQRKLEFYNGKWVWSNYDRGIIFEITKNATVDTYLCFLVGSHLLDMIHAPNSSGGAAAAASASKKKMKKKKYK